MTDKELAVQLYSSFLQAAGQALANPNAQNVRLPSVDDMVNAVKELTEKLSAIENK